MYFQTCMTIFVLQKTKEYTWSFNKCLNVVLDSTDFHYIDKNIIQKIGHWYYSDNISD